MKVVRSFRARSIISPIVPSGDCSIPCAAHVRQEVFARIDGDHSYPVLIGVQLTHMINQVEHVPLGNPPK